MVHSGALLSSNSQNSVLTLAYKIIIIHRQFLTRRNTTKSLQGRASTQWLMTKGREKINGRCTMRDD